MECVFQTFPALLDEKGMLGSQRFSVRSSFEPKIPTYMSSFSFLTDWLCCQGDDIEWGAESESSHSLRRSLVVERRRSAIVAEENGSSETKDVARRESLGEAIELAFFRASFSSFCVIEKRSKIFLTRWPLASN